MKGIAYFLLILTVPLTLYLISGDKVIYYPPDEQHLEAQEELACLGCHGDDEAYPRLDKHPPKDECFICHKPKPTPGNGQ
ncbi:MAG: hypothetical protein ISR96_08190 [Nitrospira sp.]|nr:hypothetical protein [bacterium]MBL7049477.1 hypothetical protein [Nitrospira sp.]